MTLPIRTYQTSNGRWVCWISNAAQIGQRLETEDERPLLFKTRRLARLAGLLAIRQIRPEALALQAAKQSAQRTGRPAGFAVLRRPKHPPSVETCCAGLAATLARIQTGEKK